MIRIGGIQFIAVAAIGLLVAATASSVQRKGATVREGQMAPPVELPAVQVITVLPDKAGAKTLNLKDFVGKKNVVLWFYPKALTRG